MKFIFAFVASASAVALSAPYTVDKHNFPGAVLSNSAITKPVASGFVDKDFAPADYGYNRFRYTPTKHNLAGSNYYG